MQQVLNTILGSTVVAAVIGALLGYRLTKLNKKFDYEEKKVKKNNQKLLEIYKKIEGCVYQAGGIYDINNYIYKIKECIDIRGKYNQNKADYIQDVYIWKCIENFEGGIKDKDEYTLQKKRLQEYILIKRQSDTEKLERKIKEGNAAYKIAFVMLLFATLFIGQYIFWVSKKIEICILTTMIYQLLILIESEMILNFFNDIQYYKEKKILSIVKSVIDLIVVFLILVAIFIYQVMILWITEKELDNNMHTLYYKVSLNNVYVCGQVKPYILEDHMILTVNESQVIVHFVEDNMDLKVIDDEDMCKEIKKRVYDKYELNKRYYEMILMVEIATYIMIVCYWQIDYKIRENSLKNILKEYN